VVALSADPRVYVLEEADIGCQFKVTVTPIRDDGEKGAPSTSKIAAAVTAAAVPAASP
jgi:hypothetical protein